jgi:hypothetical protein
MGTRDLDKGLSKKVGANANKVYIRRAIHQDRPTLFHSQAIDQTNLQGHTRRRSQILLYQEKLKV